MRRFAAHGLLWSPYEGRADYELKPYRDPKTQRQQRHSKSLDRRTPKISELNEEFAPVIRLRSGYDPLTLPVGPSPSQPNTKQPAPSLHDARTTVPMPAMVPGPCVGVIIYEPNPRPLDTTRQAKQRRKQCVKYRDGTGKVVFDIATDRLDPPSTVVTLLPFFFFFSFGLSSKLLQFLVRTCQPMTRLSDLVARIQYTLHSAK